MILPDGVEIFKLRSYEDKRGFFREIFKESSSFFKDFKVLQVSHSFMKRNVVKAWHYHKKQTDYWYLVEGKIKAVIVDFRDGKFGSPIEFLMCLEDPFVLKIPPLVLHGLKVLSASAHLVYFTNQEYNPNDEGRIPFNDTRIGYNWGKKIIVSDSDKREFII